MAKKKKAVPVDDVDVGALSREIDSTMKAQGVNTPTVQPPTVMKKTPQPTTPSKPRLSAAAKARVVKNAADGVAMRTAMVESSIAPSKSKSRLGSISQAAKKYFAKQEVGALAKAASAAGQAKAAESRLLGGKTPEAYKNVKSTFINSPATGSRQPDVASLRVADTASKIKKLPAAQGAGSKGGVKTTTLEKKQPPTPALKKMFGKKLSKKALAYEERTRAGMTPIKAAPVRTQTKEGKLFLGTNPSYGGDGPRYTPTKLMMNFDKVPKQVYPGVTVSAKVVKTKFGPKRESITQYKEQFNSGVAESSRKGKVVGSSTRAVEGKIASQGTGEVWSVRNRKTGQTITATSPSLKVQPATVLEKAPLPAAAAAPKLKESVLAREQARRAGVPKNIAEHNEATKALSAPVAPPVAAKGTGKGKGKAPAKKVLSGAAPAAVHAAGAAPAAKGKKPPKPAVKAATKAPKKVAPKKAAPKAAPKVAPKKAAPAPKPAPAKKAASKKAAPKATTPPLGSAFGGKPSNKGSYAAGGNPMPKAGTPRGGGRVGLAVAGLGAVALGIGDANKRPLPQGHPARTQAQVQENLDNLKYWHNKFKKR
jgi:hypothetical protein